MAFLLIQQVESVAEIETVVDKTQYRLGPGDKVEVLVKNKITYSYRAAVDLHGNMDIMLTSMPIMIGEMQSLGTSVPSIELQKVGTIEAFGLTIAEAESLLADTLSKILGHHVVVDMRLLKTRRFKIPVMGEVKLPGIYSASPLHRLSNLIISAGGLKPDANASSIVVFKGDTAVDTFDLNSFIFGGKLSENPFVSEGMRIYVPKITRWVRVEGAVYGSPFSAEEVEKLRAMWAKQPIQVPVTPEEKAKVVNCEFRDGMTVGEAIAYAGGFLPEADMDNIRIVRNSKEIQASLSDTLQPNDVIKVPFIPNEVYVTGAVVTPGAYPYQPGLTVADYIGKAGGPTERAKSKIEIYRQDGTHFYAKLDDKVHRGDRIVVHRISVLWWQDYLQIVATLTSVVVTWLMLQR